MPDSESDTSEKISQEITDAEYDKYLVPCNNNLKDYIAKYIIPEVFAFKLSNSYYRHCLCEASLEQHYNTICDIFNFQGSMDEICKKTQELLKVKYNLVVASDCPMKLERWQ